MRISFEPAAVTHQDSHKNAGAGQCSCERWSRWTYSEDQGLSRRFVRPEFFAYPTHDLEPGAPPPLPEPSELALAGTKDSAAVLGQRAQTGKTEKADERRGHGTDQEGEGGARQEAGMRIASQRGNGTGHRRHIPCFMYLPKGQADGNSTARHQDQGKGYHYSTDTNAAPPLSPSTSLSSVAPGTDRDTEMEEMEGGEEKQVEGRETMTYKGDEEGAAELKQKQKQKKKVAVVIEIHGGPESQIRPTFRWELQ